MRDVSSVTVSERRSGCKLKVSWLMVVWRIALASEEYLRTPNYFYRGKVLKTDHTTGNLGCVPFLRARGPKR